MPESPGPRVGLVHSGHLAKGGSWSPRELLKDRACPRCYEGLMRVNGHNRICNRCGHVEPFELSVPPEDPVAAMRRALQLVQGTTFEAYTPISDHGKVRPLGFHVLPPRAMRAVREVLKDPAGASVLREYGDAQRRAGERVALSVMEHAIEDAINQGRTHEGGIVVSLYAAELLRDLMNHVRKEMGYDHDRA